VRWYTLRSAGRSVVRMKFLSLAAVTLSHRNTVGRPAIFYTVVAPTGPARDWLH
jgi:hypothetical protein